jgi:hypothetical protein
MYGMEFSASIEDPMHGPFFAVPVGGVGCAVPIRLARLGIAVKNCPTAQASFSETQYTSLTLESSAPSVSIYHTKLWLLVSACGLGPLGAGSSQAVCIRQAASRASANKRGSFDNRDAACVWASPASFAAWD